MRILTLILLLASAASATGVGTSSGTVLRQVRPARTTAIGDITTATSQGIGAAWGNPAGLLTIEKRQISLTRIQSFAGITYNAIGYGQGFGDRFAAAITYADVGYGSIDGRDNTGRATGNVRAGTDIAGISAALRLSEKLTFGASGKYISERLGTFSDQAFTADVGVEWEAPWGVKLGASGENLFGSLQFVRESFALPRTFRVGASKMFWGDRLMIGGDIVKGVDTEWEAAIGAEAMITSYFLLRGGAIFNRNDEIALSTGLGIRAKGFGIDYSYTPSLDQIDDQHRVTLDAAF